MEDYTYLQENIDVLQEQIRLCLRKDRYRLGKKLSRLQVKYQKGQDVSKQLLQIMEDIENSTRIREYRLANLPKLTYPDSLPILEKRREIIDTVSDNQVVIIAGETGSGKTTQLPKLCLEIGRGLEGKIGCTQPRRVAATSISRYIASQVQSPKPAVGYKIRFHSNDSDYAYIKLMTDGILLAEIQTDRYLNEYDTIIVDEAHERTLNIDFILGYLKNLLPKRPDLKVMISSATLDTEAFSKFFSDAPIIEVEGRTYPVSLQYQPIDRKLEDLGEVTMIDMAVKTTKKIFEESISGDILIFMPTEADIRETVERIRSGKWHRALVMPLFSRLTVREQNAIFQKNEQRKIIVATNIAETSITIPGIRYVVDSGYVRMSRYCPRTRTKRLPVENISRSSAEQRKGRCGRVAEGVCIRLYSEDEFATREKYTSPEIKRSDLSEVILRMNALSLGDINVFPFIDPPLRSSIREGLATLRELGAIDGDNKLTRLGRAMAKIPTDPRTARIILEAEKEGALSEALIIVAALSIQDPRERPFEKQGEADDKHQRFLHPESDFFAYLNLWQHFHQTRKELKTQNQLRKFCYRNFLSYVRMREWCDTHELLLRLMKEQKRCINQKNSSYEQIHRAILSGFLGNIALKKEKNIYLGRSQRELMIFPGSGLFNSQHDWIVAAEHVETSRLFARTVAKIDPDWIEPLARDLCHYSYHQPAWVRKLGQVRAYEKVTLWGLVLVTQRRVHYGRIHRHQARDIFISEGLVPGEIDTPLPFLQANQEIINSVTAMENKIRKRTLLEEPVVLEKFYDQRLPDVVNIAELKQFIDKNGDHGLYMQMSDILRDGAQPVCSEQFPDFLWFGSQKLKLRYCFDLESPRDGITVQVPQNILQQLTVTSFEWLVPGWLEEKLIALLKSLPKTLRKSLVPVADKARAIVTQMPCTYEALLLAIENFVQQHWGVKVTDKDWQLDSLPHHLFMRFEIIDNRGKIVASGRDLPKLQQQINTREKHDLWEQTKRKWHLNNLRSWYCGEIPESVEISPSRGGIPHLGYPGLKVIDGQVSRTLFASLEQAEHHTRRATYVLLDLSLHKELARLQRALILPKDMVVSYQKHGWSQNLREESFICIKNYLFDLGENIIRTKEKFEQKCTTIRQQLVNIIDTWIDLLEEILQRYRAIDKQMQKAVYWQAGTNLRRTMAEVESDLAQLLTSAFLRHTGFQHIQNYPRYLQALLVRITRAAVDPARDRKKCLEVEDHLQNLQNARLGVASDDYVSKQLIEQYRWLIEEWKISIFAQEIKTIQRISPKILNKHWQKIDERLATL